MTQTSLAQAATSPWALSLPEARRRSREQDADLRAWVCLSDGDIEQKGETGGGSLAGVAFGVKDVIDVAGLPTRSGATATNNMPTNDMPQPWDAACVAQLRAAGAVPIGKTVTAEFAYMSPGPTRNPHRLDHTPGGSSSGSAAAVAAGHVELALGTQTGGSIIRPAAFCGVIGFKPTFGRIHRGGMRVLCDSLDTIGWFTRTLDQSIATAQALLGPDASVAIGTQGTRAPRVAVLPSRALATLSPAADAALVQGVAKLRALGAEIVEPSCDDEQAELLAVHGAIMHAEFARGMLPIFGARGAGLRTPDITTATREGIEKGLAISPADYAKHRQARERLARIWEDRFSAFDVILAPSAPSEAPAGLASTGSSIFNRIWSLLGWPCVHLPTGTTPLGLPVGVQLVATPARDLPLLAWARWLGLAESD